MNPKTVIKIFSLFYLQIATLKKAVKVHGQQDHDEMLTDSREAKGIEKTPKKSARSGIRAGGKFFNK